MDPNRIPARRSHDSLVCHDAEREGEANTTNNLNDAEMNTHTHTASGAGGRGGRRRGTLWDFVLCPFPGVLAPPTHLPSSRWWW